MIRPHAHWRGQRGSDISIGATCCRARYNLALVGWNSEYLPITFCVRRQTQVSLSGTGGRSARVSEDSHSRAPQQPQLFLWNGHQNNRAARRPASPTERTIGPTTGKVRLTWKLIEKLTCSDVTLAFGRDLRALMGAPTAEARGRTGAKIRVAGQQFQGNRASPVNRLTGREEANLVGVCRKSSA